MASFFERHRPQTLDELAGQPRAVATVRAALARGWGGRAFWITGPSGTGKTTLARIIARIGADAIATDELDSQGLTPARVRECVASYAARSLFGAGGKAFIVNEAHGLRKDTIRELLTALEPPGGLPGHICWLFTTTKSGEQKLFDDDETGDAAPLLSRCVEVELFADETARSAFAARARLVASSEGLPELPATVFARAVQASAGNMRRVLQRIETGAFRADALAELEREFALVRATKGAYGEQRRAELAAAMESLKG